MNTNTESWIQAHTVETVVLTILWRNEDSCPSFFLGAGKQGIDGFFFLAKGPGSGQTIVIVPPVGSKLSAKNWLPGLNKIA